MTVVARVGLALTVPAVIVWGVLVPAVRSAHAFTPVAAATAAPPPDDLLPSSPRVYGPDEEAQGELDLFGNRVANAVAKYGLDAGGTLYEIHSPNTEVPRLAPPKS